MVSPINANKKTIPLISADIKGITPQLTPVDLGEIINSPCKLSIKFRRPGSYTTQWNLQVKPAPTNGKNLNIAND